MSPEIMSKVLAVALKVAAVPAALAASACGSSQVPASHRASTSAEPGSCEDLVPSAVRAEHGEVPQWFETKHWNTVRDPAAGQCCTVLAAEDRLDAFRELGCCAVVTATEEPRTHNLFCTPWGPPMPSALV
jgi:hypothetical protein